MDKRTVASAHERIDGLEKEVVAMKTEMKIQFKDLFNRVKRMEAIIIAITGASLLLLLRMNFMQMICVLFMVGFGHSFLDGFYKSCLYDCGTDRRYYRVSPEFVCPYELVLT